MEPGTRPEACDFLDLFRSSSLVCGEVEMMCLQRREVSRSWAHHLAIRNTSPTSSGWFMNTNRSCWTAFLTFVQSAWALLLHCAAVRANYFIRVVPPVLSQEFANEALWRCLSAVLGVPPTLCNPRVGDTITLLWLLEWWQLRWCTSWRDAQDQHISVHQFLQWTNSRGWMVSTQTSRVVRDCL